MYEKLIEQLREYPDREETAGGYVEVDWQDLLDAADALESLTAQLAALQSENAELREENGCLQHNVAAMQATLDQQAENCEKLFAEKDKEIEQLTKKATLNAFIKYAMKRACEELVDTESALSRVEAERDAAIKDSVVRCCGTCNAHTRGAYNGKCMVCALCECVPENFREYHKTHYSKSLWKWRGAQGEG